MLDYCGWGITSLFYVIIIYDITLNSVILSETIILQAYLTRFYMYAYK